MFYCNYFQLNELIDVEPANGSVYIRSVTEPFDEEMELDARTYRQLAQPLQVNPVRAPPR